MNEAAEGMFMLFTRYVTMIGIATAMIVQISERFCQVLFSFFVWFLPLMQKDRPLSCSPDNEDAFTEIDLDMSSAFPYPISDNRPVFPS